MSRPALAATRAVEVINYLAAHPTESFTLSDLVDRLDINVASLHALLAVLTDAGYLLRRPRHRTYILGPALVAVGVVALEQHQTIDIARDEAKRLSKRFDLDVVVTARSRNEIIFVTRSGNHRPRGHVTHVGLRLPIRPPAGAIFFAWANHDTVEAWLKLATSAVPGDTDLDRRELEVVRSRGFSIALEVDPQQLSDALEHLRDHPQPNIRRALDNMVGNGRQAQHLLEVDLDALYDISSMASPVFDANSEVILSLNVIGFPPGLTGREVLRYGDELLSSGLVISKKARGTPPSNLTARVSVGDELVPS